MEQTVKVINSQRIARKLIQNDNRVVDIKPDKNDKKRTVFVFNVDEKFRKDLDTLMEESKKAKNAEVEAEIQKRQAEIAKLQASLAE